MIEKIDSSYFTWEIWRGGSIKELGLYSRSLSITSSEGKYLLRKYVLGYCDSESLICRPKYNQYALMCRHPETNENFWFHIWKSDFNEVFKLKS